MVHYVFVAAARKANAAAGLQECKVVLGISRKGMHWELLTNSIAPNIIGCLGQWPTYFE